jgi:SWI/SNF-related matrix-associated actin-dependent regulator 1 of chromatin subfamily A
MNRNAPFDKSISEVDISSIDPKLYQSLLPFQKQSIYFGIQLQGRILIADDMGMDIYWLLLE